MSVSARDVTANVGAIVTGGVPDPSVSIIFQVQHPTGAFYTVFSQDFPPTPPGLTRQLTRIITPNDLFGATGRTVGTFVARAKIIFSNIAGSKELVSELVTFSNTITVVPPPLMPGIVENNSGVGLDVLSQTGYTDYYDCNIGSKTTAYYAECADFYRRDIYPHFIEPQNWIFKQGSKIYLLLRSIVKVHVDLSIPLYVDNYEFHVSPPCSSISIWKDGYSILTQLGTVKRLTNTFDITGCSYNVVGGEPIVPTNLFYFEIPPTTVDNVMLKFQYPNGTYTVIRFLISP